MCDYIKANPGRILCCDACTERDWTLRLRTKCLHFSPWHWYNLPVELLVPTRMILIVQREPGGLWVCPAAPVTPVRSYLLAERALCRMSIYVPASDFLKVIFWLHHCLILPSVAPLPSFCPFCYLHWFILLPVFTYGFFSPGLPTIFAIL